MTSHATNLLSLEKRLFISFYKQIFFLRSFQFSRRFNLDIFWNDLLYIADVHLVLIQTEVWGRWWSRGGPVREWDHH